MLRLLLASSCCCCCWYRDLGLAFQHCMHGRPAERMAGVSEPQAELLMGHVGAFVGAHRQNGMSLQGLSARLPCGPAKQKKTPTKPTPAACCQTLLHCPAGVQHAVLSLESNMPTLNCCRPPILVCCRLPLTLTQVFALLPLHPSCLPPQHLLDSLRKCPPVVGCLFKQLVHTTLQRNSLQPHNSRRGRRDQK